MYWSLLQQAGESELLNMNDGNVSDGNTEASVDGTELSLANQTSSLAIEDNASVRNKEESEEETSATSSGIKSANS